MYLNFEEISYAITFKELFDKLNISYEEKNGELKSVVNGQTYIVSLKKNLFFSPTNRALKGSVINFLSVYNGVSLREAALYLKTEFLKPPEGQGGAKVPDLELKYHPFLNDYGISEEMALKFGAGYCSKGIMKGRIAIPIFDQNGVKVAYAGRAVKEDQKPLYLFPKGYKNDYIFNLHRLPDLNYALVFPDPLEAIKHDQEFLDRTLSLLSPNASDAQIEALGQIKKVLLIHKQGDNIGLRLLKKTYVKVMNEL